uniref:histone-like nucleoid-structuring protein Lsr2 n=1 Tax=Paractinoplanes polyasparticus TaxID=2856853 RepID=UPI001C84C812|nr:Lsr2 family protein [Actinoplanes polyasparticus]
MVRQVITILTDDLDGGNADRTIEFSLDGINYSIDLSDKNVDEFRSRLEPYIKAGTRVARATPTRRRGSGPAAVTTHLSNRDQNKAIREWAARNGHEISDRGRIPIPVVEAFHRQA